jgi:general stress protein 26
MAAKHSSSSNGKAKKMTVQVAPGAEMQKISKMIKGLRVAMLTTVAKDGALRARPMAVQDTPFDGVMWFFTDRTSGKTREIAGDHQVNVCFCEPRSDIYVSLSGTARQVRDKAKAKELWNPFVQVWYPKGPGDPRLALLRVVITEAEYWDPPSSKMVQMFGYIRGLMTGKRPKELDHADHHVTVRRAVSVKRPRPRSRGRVARR